MKTFFISTTIPYVNARGHIGHALEFVQADVVARYRRLQGKEVYFLSGTDENAIKNVQAAEEAGVPIQQFVDENAKGFRELLSKLNISIDQFIRTTDERHKKGAQALWEATDPRYIYKKKYRGLYCTGCEQFYKEEELNEKGECPEHPGRKPEAVEEENYFFKLSEFESWLTDLIQTDELRIIPKKRKNEVLSFIRQGLEDFSISRPAGRSKGWGVSVPGDESQVQYVWYDALANYITALGYPDTNSPLYKKFWEGSEQRLHIMGKGVSRFHAIYWPAMLKAAGLPRPTMEFVHGYLTVSGRKMSKSLGNVVDPLQLIEQYGTDAVRYFLLREIPSAEDGDFTEEKFQERYNADLAAGLGNLAARVLKMAQNAGVPYAEKTTNTDIQELIEKTRKDVEEALGEFRFNAALESVWGVIHSCDRLIEQERPWEESAGQKETITALLFALSSLGEILSPFLPETSEKLARQISAGSGESLFPRKA